MNELTENKYKLNALAKSIHEGNKERGFDVSKENIGQTLMLVVTELSEALEADRKGRYAKLDRYYQGIASNDLFETFIKDTFEDEIADAMIRLFDMAGALGIDIEKHIELKLNYNKTRAMKHGKKY